MTQPTDYEQKLRAETWRSIDPNALQAKVDEIVGRPHPTTVERPPPSFMCGAPLRLTIRSGPKAGATLVYCACGWERHYSTTTGARRGLTQHLKVSGSTLTADAARPQWP